MTWTGCPRVSAPQQQTSRVFTIAVLAVCAAVGAAAAVKSLRVSASQHETSRVLTIAILAVCAAVGAAAAVGGLVLV